MVQILEKNFFKANIKGYCSAQLVRVFSSTFVQLAVIQRRWRKRKRQLEDGGGVVSWIIARGDSLHLLTRQVEEVQRGALSPP
jgi:hypothetical protein